MKKMTTFKEKMTTFKEKMTVFKAITLIFLIMLGTFIPIMYLTLIKPRIGLMDEDTEIELSAFEIAAVDDDSVTFLIKLKIKRPSDMEDWETITVPKLDFTAYAGGEELGEAWFPKEFVIDRNSDSAFLYLKADGRDRDDVIMELLNALLHESDSPIELKGDAYIGSLSISIPPMAFSMAGEEDTDEDTDEDNIVDDFLDYIEENGVDLDNLDLDIDARGLVNFLNDFGLNIFEIFYYLDVGQEWYNGFNIGANSKIENKADRIGLEQSIFNIINGDPEKDIKTDLLKIAWDLDDGVDVFNGTPWSRADVGYNGSQKYRNWIEAYVDLTFDEAFNPEEMFSSFFSGIMPLNGLLRDRIGGLTPPPELAGLLPELFPSLSIDVQPQRSWVSDPTFMEPANAAYVIVHNDSDDSYHDFTAESLDPNRSFPFVINDQNSWMYVAYPKKFTSMHFDISRGASFSTNPKYIYTRNRIWDGLNPDTYALDSTADVNPGDGKNVELDKSETIDFSSTDPDYANWVKGVHGDRFDFPHIDEDAYYWLAIKYVVTSQFHLYNEGPLINQITLSNPDGHIYLNDTIEEWSIIPEANFTGDPLYMGSEDKEIRSMRLGFAKNKPFTLGSGLILNDGLDIEGDGDESTFNADSLTISYLDISNNLNPVTLMYDEDNLNDLIIDPNEGDYYFTPWLPTNSVDITFNTNGTNSGDYYGFKIDKVSLDFDTPFGLVPKKNYTGVPLDLVDPLDYDIFDEEPKSNFDASAYLKYDFWHETYALNQSEGESWEFYWDMLTPEAPTIDGHRFDLLGLSGLIGPLFSGWHNPLAASFSSSGDSLWDKIWWLNYHYDFRYIMNISGGDIYYAAFNIFQLLNELAQPEFFYGNLEWVVYNNSAPEGHTVVLLKDIPGFPIQSPLHLIVDFMQGGNFASMSEPLNDVIIWERNPLTGELDIKRKVNHAEYYGVADIPGTGGPYGADEAYMKALKYRDTGFLGNMKYLALCQDSRDPNSIWQMMNRLQIEKFGEIKEDTTYWNTNPLSIKKFVDAMDKAEGEGIGSLLEGIDIMDVIDYIVDKTGTTMGDIMDAAGIEAYIIFDFIFENIDPEGKYKDTDPDEDFEPNPLPLAQLMFYLIPAFIATPTIIGTSYISKRRRGAPSKERIREVEKIE